MTDRVLDRRQWLDSRSRAFAVSAGRAVPTVEELAAVKRVWTPNPVLDQGREGACVGFAVAGELGATPQAHPGLDAPAARAMYEAAQAVDRGEGRHYSSGATLLAGLKAAVQLGYASRYEWAFTYREYLYGLLRRRPALHGASWLSSMFTPRPDGLLALSGTVEGGHAIYSYGYCPASRSAFGVNTVCLAQSWGEDHGAAGRVFVRAESWWEHLQDGGETAFLLDRRP